MQQAFTILANFPGLNEIIKAAKAHPKRYSDMKRNCGVVALAYIKRAKLKPMHGPVTVHCEWVEKNGRRDPDNIRTGAKFVLDALVKAKVLPTDCQKTVAGLTDSFRVDKSLPRVVVTITQVEES